MPVRARGLVARLVPLVLLLGGLAAASQPAAPAAAADLAGFDPGHIISDAVFYDSGTMSAADVQSFLVTKGSRCSSTSAATCLKDFVQTTASKAADTRCTGSYRGAGSETAAQIITKVAVACDINPQVLLVVLQKEQGLVTATAGKSAQVYAKAMGFACPDTAPCDTQYAGFQNQVYRAAWQYQNYRLNPSSYAHRAGMVNQVRYHPNAACGARAVLIVNQATAGLYNYTPYQPNAAALAAGFGTGDACSSYGNRNFWNYFTDWFGSTVQRAPVGTLERVSTSAGKITVRGWAFDPDVDGPVKVHVYVDGVAVRSLTANGSRPDVGDAHGVSDDHGYSGTVGVSDGKHRVCTFAIDANRGPLNPRLGCATVTVRNTAPIGAVDSVRTVGGTVTVRGWTLDPDTSSSITARILVDGKAVKAATASSTRTDIGRLYGRGDAHGYAITATVPAGRRTICVDALDSTSRSPAALACKVVTVRNAAPVGNVERVRPGAGTIDVSGWALDPDRSTSIDVRVYVDGRIRSTVTASGSRTDVARAYGRGALHGFATSVPASDGTHRVCVHALTPDGGPHTSLGCTVTEVRNVAPEGEIEASATRDSIAVTGWARDPDASDRAVAVRVRLDGAAIATTSGRPGFSWSTAAGGPADHDVCVEAADASTGVFSSIGCATVTVNGTPFGSLDTAGYDRDKDRIVVTGWAIDPNTTSPIRVHTYVDGVAVASTLASRSRTDVDAAYGMGAGHGFSVALPAAPGRRTVCVWAIDREKEVNPLLGCREVVVP